MSAYGRQPPRLSLSGALGQLVLLALIVAAAGALYVLAKGFPDWAVQRALRQLQGGRYTIAVESAECHPLRGFRLGGVHAYRKGVIGPPCMEAEEARGQLDWLAPFTGGSLLKSLTLRNGIVRPALARGRPGEAAAPAGMSQFAFALRVENVVVHDVWFADLRCRVESEGARVQVEDIRGALGREAAAENLRGTASFDRYSRLLDGRFETSFDPHLLGPLVRAYRMRFVDELIERFEFHRLPPRCQFEFQRPLAEERRLSVRAKLWMQDAAYRGVETLRADADTVVELASNRTVVTISPLFVVRPEGNATVSFTVRPEEGTVDFVGNSTLDARALAGLIGIFQQEWAAKLRVEGPFEASSRGTANFRNPDAHRIVGTYRGAGIGFRRLLTESYSFTVNTNGRTNEFTDVRGRLYGGDFAGELVIVAPDAQGQNGTYAASADMPDADFARAAQALRPDMKGEQGGRMSVRLHMAGPLTTNFTHTVDGSGALRIRDGRVFMLPLFGGLTTFMARVVPGVDFVVRQSDVDTDFTLTNGVFHTDSIRIEGDVISLKGSGDVSLDGTLDFTAQIALLKSSPILGRVMHVIQWPISKLLEFRLAGTVQKPDWQALSLARDFFDRLKGLGNLLPGSRDETPESTPAP